MENQCKICTNSLNNEIFVVREMMYGTQEKFNYFRCSSCGCLQIAEIPKDISTFYPSESYYSFQQLHDNTLSRRLKNMIKFILFNYVFYVGGGLFFIKKIPLVKQWLESLVWLKMLTRQKAIKKRSSILDVGCGAGYLLQEMNLWGFKNLTGIDPFIEKDILLNDRGGKILKSDIFNHTGTYDLIMLHHSFEHMEDPHLILEQLYKMLNPNGFLLIRIPVSDSFAWRKYGVNWFQIDAPRHLFLYTTRSMNLLGKNAGFVLKQVIHDSTEIQFLYSDKYCRDISLFENVDFSPEYVNDCKKHAGWLNRIMDGDQACFLFQKEEYRHFLENS